MELDELTIRIRVAADEADAGLSAFCDRLRAVDEPARAANAAVASVVGAAYQLCDALARQSAGEGVLRSAMNEASLRYRASADAARDYADAVENIEIRAKKLASDTSAKRRAARELSDMQRVIAAYKKGEAAQGSYQKALKTLGERFGLTGLSADEAQAHIANMSRALASDMDAARDEADGLLSALYGVEAAAMIDGSVSVDTSGAHAALGALSQEAQALLSVLSALGVAAPAGGGSGGGGGRRKSAYRREIEDLEHLIAVGKSDYQQTLMALTSMELRYARLSKEDRQDLEERLYEAKEALREDNLRAELAAIEHGIAMGELGCLEQIAMYERVKAAHRLTSEEIMSIDERIYAARQALADRSAQRIDDLNQGVAAAIENRYQSMLDKELAALSESRDAWTKWSEDASRAVDEQIRALDALNQTEDRRLTDEKELRKIESLREAARYEQDEFNSAMLLKQLDDAIESRQARLRRQDTEDQKEALRARLSDIQQRADSELALLDEQEAALQAAYEERMSAASIRAESERLIAKGGQEALIALIRDYAPEYEAAGRTLGQRLAEGFADSMAEVESWFEALNEKLRAAQVETDAVRLAQSDEFYRASEGAAGSVNVNQTNVFNTPVESPSEVARRIARANEELGSQILTSL